MILLNPTKILGQRAALRSAVVSVPRRGGFMLGIPATHHFIPNELAQPHYQQSIIVGQSSKNLEFGIAFPIGDR
jgi:hypothetical protein